jgi:hypothetical protein
VSVSLDSDPILSFDLMAQEHFEQLTRAGAFDDVPHEIMVRILELRTKHSITPIDK